MLKMYRFALAAIVACILATTAVSAFNAGRVTVAITPTVVYTATTRGSKVLIRNPSAESVYIGNASVTTADGFEIAAGDAASFQVFALDKIYAVVASGTEVVHWAEGDYKP